MPKKPSSSEGGSYEVGFRKPPKRTQFRSGQSGNPRGRPRGAKTVGSTLERVLARQVVMTVDGKKKRVTVTEAMLMRTVQNALTGNPKSGLDLIRLSQAILNTNPSVDAEEPKEDPAERKLLINKVVDAFEIIDGLIDLGACEISEGGRPKMHSWFFELALANRPEAARLSTVDKIARKHMADTPDA